MSESIRIHDSIQDGWEHVREALNVVHMRLYQSDDADEKRELVKASKALTEALLSLSDARHRANLQKELVPQIVPMPYPYPVPYTPPWQPYQPVWIGGPRYNPLTYTTTSTGGNLDGRKSIVTNAVEA